MNQGPAAPKSHRQHNSEQGMNTPPTTQQGIGWPRDVCILHELNDPSPSAAFFRSENPEENKHLPIGR